MITSPVRPSYQEISLKRKSPEYEYYEGMVATQTQRDAIEETRFAVACPDILRTIKPLPGSDSVWSFAMSQMSVVLNRLGIIYECSQALKLRPTSEGLTGGSWEVTDNGRHYQIERNILYRCRQLCLNQSTKAASLLSTEQLDLLDLRVEGGRILPGALFSLPTPVEKPNPAREIEGLIQTKRPLPSLTIEQLSLLHETHEAHLAVSDWRCGLAPEPPPGIVQNSHIVLESTAISEEQHHFLRMKDFAGVVDPTWTKDEVCMLARLQDRAHLMWMDAVKTLDWARSRRAENDHQIAHVFMGINDPRLFGRFSFPFDDGVPLQECPILNGLDSLAAYGASKSGDDHLEAM